MAGFGLIEKSEKIEGGKADGMTCKEIAEKHNVSEKEILEQVEMGISHELEHTDDKKLAKEIAKDHLVENPKYYTDLKKIEKGVKTGVYTDTSENRKLGRVGQKYKKDEKKEPKKNEEDKMFDIAVEVYDKIPHDKKVTNKPEIARALKELGYPHNPLMVGIIQRKIQESLDEQEAKENK